MNDICTVLLITYNHAPYIRKAIDSVLKQKTQYNFIIYIFDDASTDGTTDIVKEYANKYPNKIIPFIAQKNQGATINIYNAYKSVKTKYCALLECDDYWCDENKLQLQIEALEQHPECSFCACNTRLINEGDKLRKHENGTLLVINKEVRRNRIISKELLSNVPFGYMNHIGSRLVRTTSIDIDSLKYKDSFLYDNCQFYYLLLQGDLYYVDKVMHYYVQTGKGTFTSSSLLKRMHNHMKNLLNFNEDTNFVISDLVFKDMKNFLNYYAEVPKLILKNDNKIIDTRNKLQIFIANFQKLKRYILPRFLIDIIDIPFNLIKYIRKEIKKKGEN